ESKVGAGEGKSALGLPHCLCVSNSACDGVCTLGND
ncbi:hypothetical protein L195_g033725, partial [Trifolium pratense]